MLTTAPESAAEMCARWHHERVAREIAIETRAEQLCHSVDGFDWDAAIACATNEYWGGDMPESVERELRGHD